MRRKAVRRIPIVSPQDTLIGLAALDDVLEVLAYEMKAVADTVAASSRHEVTALP